MALSSRVQQLRDIASFVDQERLIYEEDGSKPFYLRTMSVIADTLRNLAYLMDQIDED